METHVIHIEASVFKSAITAAMLFVDGPRFPHGNAVEYVCLHMEDDGEHFTVNALNGTAFYRRKTLLYPVFRGVDEKGVSVNPVCQSLPMGVGPWFERGQLLLSKNNADAMLKLLPKRTIGYITLEITPLEKEPHEENGKQKVQFVADGGQLTFTVPVLQFPDYSLFLTRAEALVNESMVPQGRILTVKEFARIAKVMEGEYFYVYFGTTRESPCLARQGEISIVFSTCKWSDEMES